MRDRGRIHFHDLHLPLSIHRYAGRHVVLARINHFDIPVAASWFIVSRHDLREDVSLTRHPLLPCLIPSFICSLVLQRIFERDFLFRYCMHKSAIRSPMAANQLFYLQCWLAGETHTVRPKGLRSQVPIRCKLIHLQRPGIVCLKSTTEIAKRTTERPSTAHCSHGMSRRRLSLGVLGVVVASSCSSWASLEYLEDRNGRRIQLVATSSGATGGIF